MKTKLILIGLLVAGLFIVANLTKSAQANHARQCDIVVIGFDEDYDMSSTGYPKRLKVVWIDASQGAPIVNPGDSQAAVIAWYVSQGFTWQITGVNRFLFAR